MSNPTKPKCIIAEKHYNINKTHKTKFVTGHIVTKHWKGMMLQYVMNSHK